MKRSIITLFILISIISSVLAQSDEFKPYSSFGIKQGINYSSVLFSPGVKQGITLGYNGGLVYKYQNERLFGLQVELNYIQKGWIEEFQETDNSYNRKMEYVELPFITHIVLGKRNLKYYVNLGTSFAYLLSEKESVTVNNEDYRREYYEKEIEQAFDYSGLIDLGIVYHSKIGEFQAGFRYQITFTDLFNTSSETYYDQSQNSILAFSLTYFIFSNK